MSSEGRNNPRNTQGQVSGLPVFLVAEYNGRKVTIPRNTSYQGTVASIKKNIRSLKKAPNNRILILAHLEEVDDHVQVTEDVWSDLLPRFTTIRVDLADDSSSDSSDGCTGGSIPSPTLPPHPQRNPRPRYQRRPVARNTGGQVSTFADWMNLTVDKPVIYLFPPATKTNIRVELALTQSWTFSAIYPPTAVIAPTKDSKSLGESITWTVNAKPDGTLWDQLTERELTYLFWEARINPKPLSSPPTTRPSSPVETPSHSFDPASPTIIPSHSALLPFAKVTGYIDDVLLALGLHTEARTSFITYWLPDMSKHAFIALRFLPQDEYEKAAPLDISPAPQVVTRVFMLFRGVEEGQIEYWTDAVAMAQKDASVWRDIIGADVARAQDRSLFRVLEWGGMEVK
ncbi:hypothetical protein RSOLAG22IIIB_09289 [Rhizoctonia solani]|uniref:Uncharacterized protein n=1 Tax=Rhizoctonia solani TaxID=456999 RepID=A0A0K6FYE5_9AGAM|nr:hypothetical protein RSOLAG22IIIB_09289 [Rhizoctonia solani]